MSDSGGKEANCTMYDLDKGSLIETYKEGHSGRNGLQLIGNDYLISALEDKPKMKIWQFGQPVCMFFFKMMFPSLCKI